jgi:hypothetical protein
MRALLDGRPNVRQQALVFFLNLRGKVVPGDAQFFLDLFRDDSGILLHPVINRRQDFWQADHRESNGRVDFP